MTEAEVDSTETVVVEDVAVGAVMVVVAVVAASAVDSGGCGRGEVGSRMTGFTTGGPSGTLL